MFPTWPCKNRPSRRVCDHSIAGFNRRSVETREQINISLATYFRRIFDVFFFCHCAYSSCARNHDLELRSWSKCRRDFFLIEKSIDRVHYTTYKCAFAVCKCAREFSKTLYSRSGPWPARFRSVHLKSNSPREQTAYNIPTRFDSKFKRILTTMYTQKTCRKVCVEWQLFVYTRPATSSRLLHVVVRGANRCCVRTDEV